MREQENTPREILEDFTEEFEKKLAGREMLAIISKVGLSDPGGYYRSLDENQACVSVTLLRGELPLPKGVKFPGEFRGLPVIVSVISG